MKAYLTLILALFSALAFGQTQDIVSGRYTPGFHSVPNYVKNPNCYANTRNISTSGTGAITRPTTDPLRSIASCSVAGTSSGDKVIFDAFNGDKELRGRNCELAVTYQGDASKWKVYGTRSSSIVTREIQLEDTGVYPGTSDPNSKELILNFPCGNMSAATIPTFEATASTPLTFKVTNIRISASTGTNSNSTIGPWITWTPTGTWTTNTAYTGKYRQVGQNYEYQVTVTTSGVPATGGLTINLPSGHVMDTTSIPAGSAFPVLPGSSAQVYDAGVNVYGGAVVYNNTTSVGISIYLASGTYATIPSVTPTTPIAFGAVDAVSVVFSVPIAGLSASTTTISGTNGNTDPAPYTPVVTTGTGTMTNYVATGLYYREGGFLVGEVVITFNGAVGTWSTPIVSIPSGLTMDSSKFIAIMKGEAHVRGPSGNYNVFGTYFNSSTTLGTSGAAVNTHTGTVPIRETAISNTFPDSLASGSQIQIKYRVPIVGWSNSNLIVGSLQDAVSSYGTLIGADIQSVYFGSGAGCTSPCTTGTCNICRQNGTKITSVTWESTGIYRVQGIDGGSKYHCLGSIMEAIGSASVGIIHDISNSTSTYARLYVKSTGASPAFINGSYASLLCFGKL